MKNPPFLKPLSESDRAAWRKHNLADLHDAVALPFEKKIAILEELEQIAISMGYQRDPATGRLHKP